MRNYSITKTIENNKYMEIEVKYDEGSEVFNNKRGYYIFFTRVTYENGFKKFEPRSDTNYKICIKEVKRFSNKQMEKIIDYVNYNKDEFFEYYNLNGITEIFLLLKGIQWSLK